MKVFDSRDNETSKLDSVLLKEMISGVSVGVIVRRGKKKVRYLINMRK